MTNSSSTRSTSWSQMWRDIASPELTAALEEIGSVRRLSDGQLVYQRGDAGNELYGVKSGIVSVTVSTTEGLEGLVGLYSAGTWFGEVTLFDELPRPVSAHARGAAEVLAVPSDRLRQLLDSNPIWYRDFARVLCNKLRLAMLHIESTYLPVSVRLVLRLLDLGRSFGRPGANGLVIDMKISQQTLGQMLGLTRQSINKELTDLEKRGWVLVQRATIVVVDPQAMLEHVRTNGGAMLLASAGNLL